MAFNPRGHCMPSPSSSSTFTHFSEQAINVGSSTVTTVGGRRDMSLRELDKQIIRRNLIAQEIEHRRILEEEMRRELMLERTMMHYNTGFLPLYMPEPPRSRLMLCREPFPPPEDRSYEIPFTEMSGGHHPDARCFEVARYHAQPAVEESPPNESRNFYIGLGASHGVKRKPPPSRKVLKQTTSKEDFSCAVCKITTTSEHDFNEHLSGKKHKAARKKLKRPKRRRRKNNKVS